MPATSGSVTQEVTSVETVVELESIEIDPFRNGDLAFLQVPTGQQPSQAYYRLDRASTLARTGSGVLYTRNSNPAYNGTVIGIGRWIRQNIVDVP